MICLAQLLCPLRHCVLAFAYFDGDLEHGLKQAEELFEDRQLKRSCGICGSQALHWEAGATRFKTMDEAMSALKTEEAKQIKTRALLDSMGITHDAKQSSNN